jgi:hypothetical protein
MPERKRSLHHITDYKILLTKFIAYPAQLTVSDAQDGLTDSKIKPVIGNKYLFVQITLTTPCLVSSVVSNHIINQYRPISACLTEFLTMLSTTVCRASKDMQAQLSATNRVRPLSLQCKFTSLKINRGIIS